jgi:hypothetical protein
LLLLVMLFIIGIELLSNHLLARISCRSGTRITPPSLADASLL